MKQAVALVVYRDDTHEQVLSVLRPEDDDDHPGMWGLPATSLRDDEDWLDAVHRAAQKKLGVQVVSGELVSEGEQEREDYTIVLRNYRVSINGDPDVDQDADGTTYEDWTWKPVSAMQETAEEGDSLCTSLLLDRHGIAFDRDDDIVRMEQF
ncbi:MAG: NUDIX hydrolase [Candidatus Nanohaloarchaea archaeon]|nr:NUDIX hydrolase [Candidatus Nanohaloarchaea archaeon]